jgi:aminotransferase
MDAAIRDSVARGLYERGVYTTFRYPLLHRIPAYGYEGDLPNAEWAAETTLCLPAHHGLTDGDLVTVVTALRDLLREVGVDPERSGHELEEAASGFRR